MSRMSKEAEAKIVDGIERVVDLVEAGWKPNEAIIKIAGDGDYLPGHVRMMVHSYNTGRTNYQRKSSGSLFEKTAEFPVADAGAVLEALYPEHVKTAAEIHQASAVSDDYLSPPGRWNPSPVGRLEKAASYMPPLASKAIENYQRDPDRLVKKAFNLLRDLERERDQLRLRVTYSREKVAETLNDLDRHFKTLGRAVSFTSARNNAIAAWGGVADRVMSKVAQANPNLVKEAVRDARGGEVNPTLEPYRTIAACIKAASEYLDADAAFKDFDTKAAAATDSIVSQLLPPVKPPKQVGSILKAAFLGKATELVPSLIAADTVRGIAGRLKPPDGDKLNSTAYMAVTDPSHEARLRKIRTASILHGLLSNDEFISGEQPEKVTEMFNQISQLAPRSAEQPMLMRALIRRYMAQGQVDPHDIGQMVDMETRLKGLDDPQREVNLPKLPGGNIIEQTRKPPEPLAPR